MSWFVGPSVLLVRNPNRYYLGGGGSAHDVAMLTCGPPFICRVGEETGILSLKGLRLKPGGRGRAASTDRPPEARTARDQPGSQAPSLRSARQCPVSSGPPPPPGCPPLVQQMLIKHQCVPPAPATAGLGIHCEN